MPRIANAGCPKTCLTRAVSTHVPVTRMLGPMVGCDVCRLQPYQRYLVAAPTVSQARLRVAWMQRSAAGLTLQEGDPDAGAYSLCSPSVEVDKRAAQQRPN